MLKNKNKLYQYTFLLIITLMVIFNGGNNNLYIQFNFIIISIYFLLFIKEKNYLAHVQKIFLTNKTAIKLYFLFISFLIFQIIPLPVEWLSFLSPEKYNILNKLEFNGNFNAISLSPINSYFNLLNYISLFLFLIIFKSLFYKKNRIFKFYFFIAFLGAFAAGVAIFFYLTGNPDFLILKNNIYKNYATGFFISRTVFSCFLTLCFFCGIEYLKMIDYYQKNNTNTFYNKIYVRIFILLITVGIITTFSRLGNFLFISLIIMYILQTLYKNDKNNRFFLITLSLIVLFDVLILGFYFGSEKLLHRFAFFQNEVSEYLPSSNQSTTSRAELTKFAFIEFKKFIIFGYGGGGFEYLFKINFHNLSTTFATHAHSDFLEFLGEFGLIGSIFVFLSLTLSCFNKNFLTFKNLLLCYVLIFILFFDFSFHIPIIQLLFVLLISITYERADN